MTSEVKSFMNLAEKNNPHEKEFLQAVQEVAEAVIPFMKLNTKYNNAMILERMVEPERVLIFRVPWIDDNGNINVNKGYRVEFNSAIGP